MIPLFQYDSGAFTGDCLSACLASILEIDPKTVPNFNLYYRYHGDWYKELRAWLKFVHNKKISWYNKVDSPPIGYSVMIYRVGFYKEWISHAVVGRNGEPVHCPTFGKSFSDKWWIRPSRIVGIMNIIED